MLSPVFIRLLAWPLALSVLVYSAGCFTCPPPRAPANTQTPMHRLGRIGVAFSEETTTLEIVRAPLSRLASAKMDALDAAELPWPSHGSASGGGSGALLEFGFLLAMSGIFAAAGGVAGAVSGFTAEEIDAVEKLRAELQLQPGLAAWLATSLQVHSPPGAELTGLTVANDAASPRTSATVSHSRKVIRSRLLDRGFDTLLVLRPVDCSLRPRLEKDRGNGTQFLRIEIEGQFIRLRDWTRVHEATATYEGLPRGYRGWIRQKGAPLKQEWDAALGHLAEEIASWCTSAK